MCPTACINVPALALQLLLLRHPDWRAFPVAVVEHDRPQGKILLVNSRALRVGIRPGFTYAAGLSLDGTLRADTVASTEVADRVERVTRILQRFTPVVEPSVPEPGVWWLGLSGMEHLGDSPSGLMRQPLAELREAGLSARAAIGFSRAGTYLLAKARRGMTVLASPGDERTAACGVKLIHLALPAEVHLALEQLAVSTVGEFVRLPADGILLRFGPEAEYLHRLAAGALNPVVQPHPLDAPVTQTLWLDDPEPDSARLVFQIKGRLHQMLAALAARGQALASLTMGLRLNTPQAEDPCLSEHVLQPAEPTLDAAVILDLVRLRLNRLNLAYPVHTVELAAQGIRAHAAQLRLFHEGASRRDSDAGNRVLAQLRAEFGESAVVRAVLKEGHLPEAQFAWEPVRQVTAPQVPHRAETPPLVRRLYRKPIPTSNPLEKGRDGQFVEGQIKGRVMRVSGRDRIAGGWWRRGVHRDYVYAELASGDWLWMYFDRLRRRWFLHGRVE